MMSFPANLYGESVFTTTRVSKKGLLFEKKHFGRLFNSIQGYYLDEELSSNQKEKIVFNLKNLIPTDFEGIARLNISAPARSELLANNLKFEDLIFEVITREYSEKEDEKKLALFESPFTSHYPDMKMGSYMPLFLLKKEALKKGFDDALLRLNDFIVSGSTSNIFFVKGDEIYTPKQKILSGIIQSVLVEDFNGIEKDISSGEIENYDYAFLTNSASIITGVNQINDTKYNINRDFLENIKSKVLEIAYE